MFILFLGVLWLTYHSAALAYCIPVIPTSLARWFVVVHGDVKPNATSEAQFADKLIFSLSGLVDVIVFLLIRHGLLLFDHPMPTRPPDSQDAVMELTQVEPGEQQVDDKAEVEGSAEAPAVLQRHPNARTGGECVCKATSTHLIAFAVLLALWLGVNASFAVWIKYYIKAATVPGTKQGENRSTHDWIAFYFTSKVLTPRALISLTLKKCIALPSFWAA